MAGSRHAWNRSGKAGEPPGWEADEEEAVRNADSAIDEGLQRWTGYSEGDYALIEEKLEEMERELVRKALTVWSGFADFCARSWGSRPGSSWRRLRGRSPKGCETSRS